MWVRNAGQPPKPCRARVRGGHRPRSGRGCRPRSRSRAPVVLADDGDAVREPACDHAAQAFGAIFVVGDVVDERVREARAARRHAVDVGLQPWPARESVLARDRALRVAQARCAARLTDPWPACAGAPGSGRGVVAWSCSLLSTCPSSAYRAGKEGSAPRAGGARVGSALPADGARPSPRLRNIPPRSATHKAAHRHPSRL